MGGSIPMTSLVIITRNYPETAVINSMVVLVEAAKVVNLIKFFKQNSNLRLTSNEQL